MKLSLQSLMGLSAVSFLALGCGQLDQADMGDAGMGQDAGASADDANADADADADAGMDDEAGDAGHDGGDDDGAMAYDGGDDAGDGGGDEAGDDGSETCNADDPCDCPDSAEALAGECTAECTEWFAKKAFANPVFAQHAGGHAIVAPGFYCDAGTTIFDFDGVELELTDDGARMHGTAVVESDGCGGGHDGRRWELDVELDAAPESMLPKRELKDPDFTQPPAVTEQWRYYAFVEGHATMVDLDTGASATLSHRPADLTYGFQIGYTANGKNMQFGASGWFFFDHDGECGRRTGVGDFNIDLHELCD